MAGGFAASIAGTQAAPVTVVSITTHQVDLANQTRSVTSSGGTSYTVNYTGIEERITSLTTTESLTYTPLTQGIVRARRSNEPAGTPFNLSNANQTIGYNAVQSRSGTGNTTHNVYGVYTNTMEALFQSNNIYTGTENLFVNSDASPPGGNGTNVTSNIERMDFIFTGGLSAATTLGFTVFERGNNLGAASGHNGGFKIAAITAVDINGDPTNFGTAIRVTDNSYSNGNAGVTITNTDTNTPITNSYNYDVFRYNTATGPELDYMNNPFIGPQGIAGVFIKTTDLIAAGTTIYGYALFGEDVTATGGTQLLDINNITLFPHQSNFDTNLANNNDMDMVSTGAVLYQTPEPGTGMLMLAALGSVTLLRGRRQR